LGCLIMPEKEDYGASRGNTPEHLLRETILGT
jgi:hypothetical protein